MLNILYYSDLNYLKEQVTVAEVNVARYAYCRHKYYHQSFINTIEYIIMELNKRKRWLLNRRIILLQE